MAWNDPTEIVVANSGAIYVAPVGTALPANESTALNVAFTGLGFTTDDGVTLTVNPQFQEFMAWQSRQPIRTELVNQEIQVNFELEQWNDATIPLAFGGGTVVDLTGGHYRYDVPTSSTVLDERAVIVDAQDGTKLYRIVFPRAIAVESVATKFTRNDMATLPLTIKALQPNDLSSTAYLLSNDAAAFATGS